MNPATDWIDQARGLLDMLKQGIATPSDGAEHGSETQGGTPHSFPPLMWIMSINSVKYVERAGTLDEADNPVKKRRQR